MILTSEEYYIVERLSLAPGESTSLHKHPQGHEVIVVISGAAHIHTSPRDDVEYTYDPIPLGASYTVHKDMYHCITNKHVFDDVVYICVCVGKV